MKAKHKKKKNSRAEILDLNWEMQFYELQKFKKKYGHCDVPKSKLPRYKRYQILANWCSMQRQLRKFNSLKYDPDRLHKLNNLGFCWNKLDKLFEQNFNRLKQYREKFGNCNVDWNKNKALAQWCVKQRIARRTKFKALTKERIKRLTELGFAWHNLRKEKLELIWEQQFTLLKEYKKKHGHCNASFSKTNHAENVIACWAQLQRKHYRTKNKLLTTEKITKLNSIGFSWISPFRPGQRHMISDQELITDLKRLYAKLGSAPSGDYIKAHGKYSAATYIKRYGNIANARKAAGIHSGISRKIYSEAEMLDDLKRIATFLGRAPNNREVRQYGKYSSYYDRFGNLANALEKAGINSLSSKINN